MKHLDSTTLNLYLDDALDAAARAQAAAHLATCEACRRELSALQSLIASFDAWRPEPIPHDISVAVVTQLATRPAPVMVSRWGAAVLGVQALFVSLVLLWLAPMALRMLNGLPFELVPTFDFSAVTNFADRVSAVALPFPSFAPMIWIAGLVGVAVVWLVSNRLLLRSLNKTQEASH
jgi:anti-sigma factor RsiW